MKFKPSNVPFLVSLCIDAELRKVWHHFDPLFPLNSSPLLSFSSFTQDPSTPPFSASSHLQSTISMAGKSIVPFVGSESTYGLNSEPSPANQALASPAVEEEAMHIATTPLAILPAPGRKMMPRGTEEGAADPLVCPNKGGGHSASPSAWRIVKRATAQRGRGRRPGTTPRPTTGELHPKDVVVRLFADLMPPMPMEEGMQHAYTMRNKCDDIVSHHYTTSLTPVSDHSPKHFRVVGVLTPGEGYGKGLFPTLSPKEKGEAESVASTPKRVKR